MLKKSILGASALALLAAAGSANAADVTVMPRDWSGFYAGLHVGLATAIDSSLDVSAASFEDGMIQPLAPQGTIECRQQQTREIRVFKGDDCPNGYDPTGNDPGDAPGTDFTEFFNDAKSGDDLNFLAGVNFGFNMQHGALVFGVEADMSKIVDGESDLEATAGELPYEPIYDGMGPQQNLETQSLLTSADGEFGLSNVGTLRARLGYDIDGTWLPFITGGLAWGRVSTEGTATYDIYDNQIESRVVSGGNSVTRDFGDSEYEMGWTLGAGINYRIADNTFLGLTYLYTDLGTHDFEDSYTDVETGLTGTVEGEVDARFHQVRLSFDIMF